MSPSPSLLTAARSDAAAQGRCRRLLALVPPDAAGRRAAAYTFLQEELAAFVQAGIAVHTVSSCIETRYQAEGVVVHPTPRTRRLGATLRALPWSLRPFAQTGVCGSVGERLYYARTFASIATVIRQERIDVVYSPFAWPDGTAAAAVTQSSGVPLVLSLRGCDILVEPSIGYGNLLDRGFRRRLAFALPAAKQVVCVSRALAARAVELGAPPERVCVALKGVDHRRFTVGDKQQAREALNLPDRPTLLFVGNLLPCKGVALLPDALQKVQSRVPDVQLVLCGEGRLRRELEQAFAARGLKGHIHLVGRIGREEIPRYFQAANVFLFPSLSEGSGNALLEAAASGLPAAAADVGGIPDYLDHEATGFLFRKGDAADLAAKTLALLENPALAERLGQAARRRVETSFRYEQMISRLVALFHQAAE